MAIELLWWGGTMVSVAFIVEGHTEVELLSSHYFRHWLQQKCGITMIGNPKTSNCKGNGNMCTVKLENLARIIKKAYKPDYIVVLADLDPNDQIKCITRRKQFIGEKSVDLIIVARNSIEAWFLADTKAMQSWLGKESENFREAEPEIHINSWERLEKYAKAYKAKLPPNGSKKDFARLFIQKHQFDLERAASHKNCPSAKYCVEKLKQLGQEGAS